MALKPTIYKFSVSLSDLDKNYFDTLNLIVAQHPSETIERMMARTLALCLNASERIEFTKGLSTPEVPDIWEKSLDDQFLTWIDVGEPAFERIKKACRQANNVKVYSFNSKSDIWWKNEKVGYLSLKAEIFQFPWGEIQALAKLVERTMEYSVTISDNTLYIATEKGEAEILCQPLN